MARNLDELPAAAEGLSRAWGAMTVDTMVELLFEEGFDPDVPQPEVPTVEPNETEVRRRLVAPQAARGETPEQVEQAWAAARAAAHAEAHARVNHAARQVALRDAKRQALKGALEPALDGLVRAGQVSRRPDGVIERPQSGQPTTGSSPRQSGASG